MKLRKKGKDSEWFGVEHYHVFHEMDLFKCINLEKLQMLYPDIFGKSKPKLVKKRQRTTE